MKRILLVVSLFIPSLSFAQSNNFGLIQDKDGYVNVRQQASLKAKVIGRLNNQTVVSLDSGGNSTAFYLIKADGLNEEGFIHKSRINPFGGYQRWKLKDHYSDKAIYQFADNFVELQVKIAQFTEKDFKKTIPKGLKMAFYTYYKNKEFFGTDGDIPEKGMGQFKQILINFNGENIVIPAQKLEQYFFPLDRYGNLYDFEQAKVYSKGNDLYVINTLTIGGAAQYNMVIHIQNGLVKPIQAWSE